MYTRHRVRSRIKHEHDEFGALSQVIRLRAKLTNAAASVKGLFGVKSEKDSAVQKLEALKVRPQRRVSSVLRDLCC